MEVLHQCTMKETDHILIVHNHETAEQGDLQSACKIQHVKMKASCL